jgi:predicted N-acyltransferase
LKIRPFGVAVGIAVIELRVHSSLREIPEADWNELAGADAPPFMKWAWLDAMERTGCVGEKAGWLPHHISLWESGRMVAVAPAYLKGNSEGEFVFDHAWAGLAHRLGVAYYPKLLVAVPFTPATSPRLLVREAAERPRLLRAFADGLGQLTRRAEISSAHVLFPAPEEARGLGELGMLERNGLQFHWRNEGYATFDDFLARFSSKRRHQIRRERRALAEANIHIETLRGDAIKPPIIDAMYAFYLTTVDKFVWGRRYLNRAFFEEVCARLKGGIEIVLAREGAQMLGGALNLASTTTLYGRYWGATAERPFLHFNVCFYHSIDDCIQRGLRVFEPGAGGEHKLVRGFLPTLTYSAHYVAHPRMAGIIAAHLEREREALRDAVQRESEEAWGKSKREV